MVNQVSKTDPNKKLTLRQEAFVEEYLVDLNGRQAAIRAGYSEKGAERQAYGLLRLPYISKAIKERMAKASERSKVSPEWVLNKIAKAVNTAETDDKLNEMLRGLELLGRHLSLFVDRTEVTGKDGEAIQMEKKVQEDAETFTSSIAGLVARSGKTEQAG